MNENEDDGGAEAPECECCGGPLAYLGNLGTLSHFRCINCGMITSERGGENYSLDSAASEV